MIERDVAALTQSSTLIVKAKVVASKGRWTKAGMHIITDTALEVLEVWKGQATGRITVMQPGGVVGEIGQKVHGAARFDVNEEVIAFLEARGNHFTVTSMAQGVFHLRSYQDNQQTYAVQLFDNETQLIDPIAHKPTAAQSVALTLAQLKAQVLKALNVPPETSTTPIHTTPR